MKFRTSARNFVNGETIEASEISPKIRSPRNFADLRRISSKFDEIRYHYFCTVLYIIVLLNNCLCVNGEMVYEMNHI